MPINANQFAKFIEFTASSGTVFISMFYLGDLARKQRVGEVHSHWGESLCYLGLAMLGLILVGISMRVLTGIDTTRRRLIVVCITLGATASIIINFLDHGRPSVVLATYFVPQLLLLLGGKGNLGPTASSGLKE